jgi:3-oxoacyl-[acyl-carrier-protein] synthase II
MSDALHNAVVRGVGWLDEQDWGSVFRRQRVTYGDPAGVPPWKQGELFAGGIKNVGRFDRATRMTVSACGLALWDAGVSAPAPAVGLIGTNAGGSLLANRSYFEDYLQAGRVMARGNLFIYTLPSSPLAETAIHFGLQGPLLYAGFPGGGVGDVLQAGVDLIGDGTATEMLAVYSDEKEGLAFLIGRQEPEDHDIEKKPGVRVQKCAGALAEGGHGVRAWISQLQRVMDGSDGV